MTLKKHFTPFSFLIAVLFSSCLLANQDSLVLAIKEAKDSAEFETYYKSVSGLEKFHIKEEDYQKLTYHDYYDYVPKTTADSLVYRKYTMLHGFRLFKHVGNIHESLNFYLLSHTHLPVNFGFDNQVWFTEKHIASHYARLNDYDMSLRFASIVEKHLIGLSDLGKLGRLYSDVGDLYLFKSDTTKAIEYFKLGIDLGYETDNHKAIAANQTSLAKVYIATRKYDQFNSLYKSIKHYISKLDTTDYNYLQRVGEVDNLYAEFLVTQGKFSQAENQLRKSLKNYKRSYRSKRSRLVAKEYKDLGLLALHQNDLGRANKYFHEGLNWVVGVEEVSSILNGDYILAENTLVDLFQLKANILENEYMLSSNTAKLDSALLFLSQALETNDWLHNNLILTETKLLSIAEIKNILSQAVDICYELWLQTNENNYLEKASIYFNKSKAVILNDRRLEKAKINRLPQLIKDSIKRIESELISTIDKFNDVGLEEDLDETVFVLKERLVSFKKEVLDTDINQVEISTPYVEMFWLNDKLFVLDNFSQTPFRKIINAKEVEVLIESILESIGEQSDNYKKGTLNLVDLLFPEEWEKQSEITFIPDGKLLTVPLSSLFLEVFKEQDLPYLKSNFSGFGPVYSEEHSQLNSILVLSPDYTEESNDIGVRDGVLNLPFAKEEAKEIKASWNENFTIINKCNLSDLVELSLNHDVFHYAGHAIGTAPNPSLILLDEKGDTKYISNAMIEETNLDFNLVTLSACQTGLGKISEGEGVRSMAYSFLSAGARNVVYSMWSVNDKSTAKLMALFYNELANGCSANRALAIAQSKFLEQASPEERHPFYWAGFICVGEEYSMKQSNNKLMYIFLASFVFLTLAIYVIQNLKP